MKRSDMILSIAEHLITGCNVFGGAQDERNEVRESTKMYRHKLAHEMLKWSEQLGMLPPDRPIVIELEPPYVEHLPGVPMVAQIENSNTWEPEDFKIDMSQVTRAEVPETGKTMDELRREDDA